jgi:glycosyltransferase involved in cell wall biosynthesis
MIAALDRYVSTRDGALSVFCLNDPPPLKLPQELSGLTRATFTFFSGHRNSYILNFISRVRKATLVIYGLLGFTPLILIQRIMNPKAHSLLTLHGIEAWQYRSYLHAWGVRKMDCFVSVSQYTLDTFQKAYRIQTNHLSFVVPNPIAPFFLKTAEALSTIGTSPPRLLSVTRLDDTEQSKGVDSVIRALPSLLHQFPNLIYTIVGHGSDRSRLEILATQLGVRESVHFSGFISDEELRAEFARCTLYVMPSAKEGFGFVFIEAMAYGKPVVAARAGATPEVVEDGKTGFLVEYGSVLQLVEVISLLLNDEELRFKMGLLGRETVRKKYTFDAFLVQWSLICDSLGIV